MQIRKVWGYASLLVVLSLVGFAAVADDHGGVPGSKDFEFSGTIQTLPTSGFTGDWMVSGKTVHVTAATRIDQDGGRAAAVGATVKVKGALRTDGSVDAARIQVKEADDDDNDDENENENENENEFVGLIQSLPGTSSFIGDWTVGGKTVHVTASTRLNQKGSAFAVGVTVEVEGPARADGSIDATEIELNSSGHGPGGLPPGEMEFRGAVESLPATPGFVGDAVVSGRTVHISTTTRIEQEDGALAVGAMVEVKGTTRADGSIDATRIEVEFGEDSAAAGQSNDFHLSSAARKAGLNGSFFTTSLTLSNTGTADAAVTIKFLGHDRDGRNGLSRTITVPAGATLTINDLLGSFFGIGDDFGGVRITSNVPTLVVDSHTGTSSGPGSFGQQLRATEHNDLITSARPRSIAGVRSNGAFRTNLMLSNATGKPLDVDVKLIGSDGRERGSSRIHLQPLEMRQMNDAPRELGGGAETGDDARLLLSTATPNGAFAAVASRIDNASNDPSALIPR